MGCVVATDSVYINLHPQRRYRFVLLIHNTCRLQRLMARLGIGLAVPILLTWHLYLVARGETSIESHDNEYFAKKAQQEGLVSLRLAV